MARSEPDAAGFAAIPAKYARVWVYMSRTIVAKTVISSFATTQ